MPEPDVVRTVLRFVNEINRHDVPALLALVSADHKFVDSLGREIRGRERLREAWTAYFDSFPDYRILIEDHLEAGIVVGLFGTASGTFAIDGKLSPERRWKIPASWRAVGTGGARRELAGVCRQRAGMEGHERQASLTEAAPPWSMGTARGG